MSQPTPLPNMRLDFWSDTITLVDFNGASVAPRQVSEEALAQAFSDVRFATGMLPPYCLSAEMLPDKTFAYAVYIPPHVRELRTETRTYSVPLPGLILTGRNTRYALYAVRSYPDTRWHTLYWPPFSNIMSGNQMCLGNNESVQCKAETIHAALDRFTSSIFTPHIISGRSRSHPDNIYKLWATLDGDDEFPLNDLVACGKSLKDIV